MKDHVATKHHEELFVVQVDGRAKSRHHRFLDALRASLILRDEFPEHDVKLRSVNPDPRKH